MAGAWRGALAILAVAAVGLGAWTLACAAPDQPTAADTQASQISPPAASAPAEDQIPGASGGAAQTGQIAPAAGAVGADQLSPTMAVAQAPPPLSSPAQGRDTRAPAIHGHDRCDAAAGASLNQPACANILDHKADQFSPPTSETARTANPDAPAAGLVNDIVNGGTGTVVIAPTDGK